MSSHTNSDSKHKPLLTPQLPRTRGEWFFFLLRAAAAAVLLFLFFWFPELYSHTTKTGLHLAKKRLLLVPAAALLCVLLPQLRLRIAPPLWLRAVLAAAEIFGGVLFAMIMCEWLPGVRFWEMNPPAIRMNYWLGLAVFAFFLGIFGLRKAGLVLAYYAIVDFSVLNYCILQFRGDPLTAADLFVAGTAAEVAGSYTFPMNATIYAMFFGGLLLWALLAWLPAERAPKWKGRLALSLCALLFSCGTFYLFAETTYPENKGVGLIWFNPVKRYRQAGELLYFTHGFYSLRVEKPEGYSTGELERLLGEGGYASDSAAEGADTRKPNIIVVMNESLTDFTTYDTVEPSEDPFAFIHSLQGQDNAVLGHLHVDVFGGQTANTEYEVLTGNSVAFLPPNATAYVLFMTDRQPSFTWNLQDLGYGGSIAFHPHNRKNYNRDRAYDLLGFDRFVSKNVIQSELTESAFLREHISDAWDLQKVISLYEETRQKNDAPFWLFNVTMQNHGPFDQNFDNFEQDITLGGVFKSDNQMKRFINLADYSDEAFEQLAAYFSGVEEPTVLVMFGDHQPKLRSTCYERLYGKPADELEGEELFGRYQTPLVIWANYDINPGGALDEVFSDISVNYLNACLTEALGLPMTAQQKFLADMHREIPVFTQHGYLDREGNIHELSDDASPLYPWVRTYRYLAYNYQFDKKNLLESFFLLTGEDPSFHTKEPMAEE